MKTLLTRRNVAAAQFILKDKDDIDAVRPTNSSLKWYYCRYQDVSFENQDVMKNMIFPINTTTRFFKALVFTVKVHGNKTIPHLLSVQCYLFPYALTE